ncbi:MAG TPA: hypothetical protein VGJ84_08225 [Polyangiaceae bacterium]
MPLWHLAQIGYLRHYVGTMVAHRTFRFASITAALGPPFLGVLACGGRVSVDSSYGGSSGNSGGSSNGGSSNGGRIIGGSSGINSGGGVSGCTLQRPAAYKGAGTDTLIFDAESVIGDFEGLKIVNNDNLHVTMFGGFADSNPELTAYPATQRIRDDSPGLDGHDGATSQGNFAAQFKYKTCYAPVGSGLPNEGFCWGGGTGWTFEGCYDASAYGGFEIWLKGSGAGWVTLDSPQTASRYQGGPCATDCGYTIAVTLTPEWTLYSRRWSEIIGGPSNSAMDPTKITDVVIWMCSNGWCAQDGPIDIDITFDEARWLPK